MNKEKLFEEYAMTYKDYLYGKCSYHDTCTIIEKIEATIKDEAENEKDVRSIVKANEARISKIEEEAKAEYNKVAEPIIEELLEFLQFRGLVKSLQYEKKAEELKEKLQEYDKLFQIREKALMKFYVTKIGSQYNDYRKMKLLLRLGALDMKNI